jgi:hypothetical protein
MTHSAQPLSPLQTGKAIEMLLALAPDKITIQLPFPVPGTFPQAFVTIEKTFVKGDFQGFMQDVQEYLESFGSVPEGRR